MIGRVIGKCVNTVEQMTMQPIVAELLPLRRDL